MENPAERGGVLAEEKRQTKEEILCQEVSKDTMSKPKLQVVPKDPEPALPPQTLKSVWADDPNNPAHPDFDFWAAPKKLQDMLRAEGFPVPLTKEEIEQRKEAAKKLATAPKRRSAPKRKKGESDVSLAKQVVEEFPAPLAVSGGSFWRFSVERGWEICDEDVHCAAHEKLGRNADNALIPIIKARLTMPRLERTTEAPVYMERIGGRWEGHWSPLVLTDTQVLYTDGIYDVVTEDWISTEGRIIYGPMVSLQWTQEGGDAPDISEIEAFVASRLPDPDVRRHFQEVVACILQPHVVFRGQIVLWGPPLCGKTSLANMIVCAPAGALGVARQQESKLATSKWASNQLVNCFANLSDDSRRVAQWTEFVKEYTSGMFTVEPKFGKPVSAVATAKLFSTCNEMQDTSDASGAMVDRLMPFRIENRIEGKTDYRYMTPQHWCRPEVRNKVVEWLLQGLARLRKRGDFDLPSAWVTQKAEAVATGDLFEGWLVEHLEAGNETDSIKKSDILAKLPREVCENATNRAIEMRLAEYLKRLFGSGKDRVEKDGEKIRIYRAIRWK